jgi:hypothetical protein
VASGDNNLPYLVLSECDRIELGFCHGGHWRPPLVTNDAQSNAWKRITSKPAEALLRRQEILVRNLRQSRFGHRFRFC